MKPTLPLAICLIQSVASMVGLAQSTVQFRSSTYAVSESAGSVALTIQRAGDTNTEVTVNVATADGTAIDGLK